MMRPQNQKQYDWSMQMLPAVSEILQDNASVFIRFSVAAPDDDRNNATDMQLRAEVSGSDIAVRLRKASCRHRDLTIRSYSNGNKTELHKLKEGKAKWYVYGWENVDGSIDSYMILDLDTLRGSGLLENRPEIRNKDNTAFVVVPVQELFDRGCIRAYRNLPVSVF